MKILLTSDLHLSLPWIAATILQQCSTGKTTARTRFEVLQSKRVLDILAGDERAVILGSLESKLKRTGKIIKTDFAIVLTVANGEIVRFQMLEDSFAVAQAAHG
jgi:ketosteroid isomerase-like protein